MESSTSSFTVENCNDLEMSIIPNIKSAGENRSVLYEINLENTGTQQNEYNVRGEGPDWISVRPQLVTVEPGQTGKSYIYAGIPYDQVNGTTEITVFAEGEQVEREDTVRLRLGEEVRDAIKSPEGGGITGMFRRSASNLVAAVTGASNLVKLAISILIGIALSAAILYKEW